MQQGIADGTVPDNAVVGCWSDTSADCTTPTGPLANNAANDGPWDALHGVPTLTTIGNNIHPDEFIDGVADANFPLTHADVIYHGWHAGLEYIW